MSTDKVLLRKIVEGALLAAGQPLSVGKLTALFESPEAAPEEDEIQAVLEDIQADCHDRGYELKEVGTGWRFQVREETAPWVNRLWEEKPQKYSRALLETLALVAYRQPITRGDIEEIRGVAVSSHIMKTLTEREWIKVVGHRDVPGRPSLYATTRQFLDYFNLTSLEDLPSLSEISDLEKLNPELELNIDEPSGDDVDEQTQGDVLNANGDDAVNDASAEKAESLAEEAGNAPLEERSAEEASDAEEQTQGDVADESGVGAPDGVSAEKAESLMEEVARAPLEERSTEEASDAEEQTQGNIANESGVQALDGALAENAEPLAVEEAGDFPAQEHSSTEDGIDLAGDGEERYSSPAGEV